MHPERTATDWTLLFTLVLLWGTSFLFTRIAVATVPPATLVAGRLTISALVLTILVRGARLAFPSSGRLWLHFLALAVVGNALPFFLISWGQERIDSGLAGVLMAVMPLATLVLAHFYVQGDRMTARKTAGFALGFAGIVALTGPDALREIGGSNSEWIRQMAVLGGALCYAINTIIARRLPPNHSLVVAAAVMIAASVVMIPVALAVDTPWNAPTASSLAAVVWLGVASTAAANVVYFRLIASAGPTFLSLINYQIPVVALLAGMVVLAEKPPPRAFFALTMVLSGLALSQSRTAVGGRPEEISPL